MDQNDYIFPQNDTTILVQKLGVQISEDFFFIFIQVAPYLIATFPPPVFS